MKTPHDSKKKAAIPNKAIHLAPPIERPAREEEPQQAGKKISIDEQFRSLARMPRYTAPEDDFLVLVLALTVAARNAPSIMPMPG